MSNDERNEGVLFVCTGNLCRSPMAMGIFRALAADTALAELPVDSAGIHAVVDQAPEPFAIAVAETYGVDISGHMARQVEERDFARFRYVVAFDLSHLDFLRAVSPQSAAAEIELLMGYAEPGPGLEVADPYGKRRKFFEAAARQIELGVRGLMTEILSAQVRQGR